MQTGYTTTPEGTRDLLFEECRARTQAVDAMRELFSVRGFDEVMTPSLEFYDVFGRGAGSFPQESMFKLTDSDGRLVVMRPDNTTPIARMAASKLKCHPLPLRLYYHQPVFRTTRYFSGKSIEIPQMGVELIGAGSYSSDLEVLSLAAACLRSSGKGFRLEIGHIGFFKALMEKLEAPDQYKESIRLLVEQKNYAALHDLLQGHTGPVAEALKRLPRLFGGEEVLEKAHALFGSQRAADVLAYLRRLFRDLGALGLQGSISIDLGLVNQADYYSGVIFRGYMEGAGEGVLSGGRYDNLLAAFGNPMPAIGFGVNVELMAQVCLNGSHPDRRRAKALIHAAGDKHTVRALAYMEELTQKGVACENSVWDTQEEALDYARTVGIPYVHLVAEDIAVQEVAQ